MIHHEVYHLNTWTVSFLDIFDHLRSFLPTIHYHSGVFSGFQLLHYDIYSCPSVLVNIPSTSTPFTANRASGSLSRRRSRIPSVTKRIRVFLGNPWWSTTTCPRLKVVYIYIYICVCACVCVYVYAYVNVYVYVYIYIYICRYIQSKSIFVD